MIIEGIITDKQPYMGTSPKAPAGTIFIGRDKFTCWRDDIFAQIHINSNIILNYSEQENTSENKTYINKSVVSIEVDEPRKEVDPNEQVDDIQPENIAFKTETFKINGFTYRITGALELQ